MRSGLPGVWACFIWLVCLLAIVVLVLGCCPFPMFIGNVLSVFRFLREPATCNCYCLWGTVLLEINS